ncbi:acetate--CoA ligase family protein [Pseudonocardia kujensis]|uniref:acetate--CoA ligase family protein n=1 Tax=Pseudonocardia kujensis TaxID=1128675 RepID=UPI001E62B404|nr:acetate--CoA ligase family protein [Pseudonocardia kujensis]MCE0765047.1 acetate--CoA ligase family protein [Pseudonocardia kujensis]
MPDLTRLLTPTSVAVVGASERPGSLARRVVENLADHSVLAGGLHLVNPTRAEVLGRPCVSRVADLPPVDVAVVVIPAAGVVGAVEECAAAGIPFAVVLTSGFGEVGEEGAKWQRALTRIAAETGIRIVGPNCPGLTNVRDRVGMTFSPAFPVDLAPGTIGLATQGGGLGRNILQAGVRGLGTSVWASLGNAADLDVPDLVAHFADDPQISTIVTLLEGIPDGRSFLAAVRKATAAGKPVVTLKVGRSEYGRRAIESHTAAMAGEADVNSAVFAQFGVVEVDDIDELSDVASLLSRAVPPADAGIAIWGLSGGALSLCADAVGQAGLRLAELTDDTKKRLAEILPSYAAIENPVDTTATALAEPELVAASLRVLAADPGVDIVLYPNPLDYGTDTVPVATAMVEVQAETTAPLVPIWMSDRRGPAYTAMTEGGLVPIHSISKAVQAVARWASYGAWRAAPPGPLPLLLRTDSGSPTPAVRTEVEAKAWLAESGIAVPAGRLTTTADEAAAAAAELPGPAVLKIVSPDVAHKSDVGGVQVGIHGDDAVRAAYTAVLESVGRLAPHARVDGVLVEEMVGDVALEMLVGVHVDPVFGHLLTVGAGGVLVELLDDVQRRLLPLDADGAREMVQQLRVAPLLQGHRGGPRLDINALVDLLVRVSDLVTAHPDLTQLELNPVVLRPADVEGQTVLAVDAVVEVEAR